MKLLVLDRLGWPVERIRGRHILNAVRLLLHGRRVVCRDCWYRRQERAREEQA